MIYFSFITSHNNANSLLLFSLYLLPSYMSNLLIKVFISEMNLKHEDKSLQKTKCWLFSTSIMCANPKCQALHNLLNSHLLSSEGSMTYLERRDMLVVVSSCFRSQGSIYLHVKVCRVFTKKIFTHGFHIHKKNPQKIAPFNGSQLAKMKKSIPNMSLP